MIDTIERYSASTIANGITTDGRGVLQQKALASEIYFKFLIRPIIIFCIFV